MIKWDSDIYLTRLTAKITWDHFCQRIPPSRRTWIDSISAPKTVSLSLYAVNIKAISTVMILNIGSLFSRFSTPWGNFLFKRLHSCPLVSMSRRVQTSTQSHPEPCVQLAVCLDQFWGQKAEYDVRILRFMAKWNKLGLEPTFYQQKPYLNLP